MSDEPPPLVPASGAPGSPKPVWFTIDVKIQGFVSVDSNGRKSYTKGMVRKWVVDHKRVVKVARGDADFAEVTLMCADNIARRHTVDFKNHTCSCRRWQLTGKPCWHALAWIRSNRGVKIEDFVHPYYSVNKFKAAYAGIVPSLTDRTQWPVVGLGFTVFPPMQKRGPGRPKVTRIRGALEGGKKRVRCKRCRGWGHFEKTCKEADPPSEEEEESDAESVQEIPTKRKRQPASTTEGENHPSKKQKKTTTKKKTPTKKKTLKKKKTPKKKKTSQKKKKAQAAASAPPKRVVRKFSEWLAE